MRRFAVVLVLSVLGVSAPADARPTLDSPVQSNRICGLLVEVNRDTFRWVVATDPTIMRDDPFVRGQASSRFAAWMWGRAVANHLGGC